MKKKDRGKFGSAFRDARYLRNISQMELAKRAGMSAENLCEIEMGRRSPTLASIEKLEKALNAEVFIFVKLK